MKFLRKTIIALSLTILIGLLTMACSRRDMVGSSNPVDKNKITIYTSFYPLYDFTSKIVGDRARVKNILPPGLEAHDFEPSPRQMTDLYSSQGLVYLGQPMDSWAQRLVGDLEDQGVRVLEAGKGLMENNDPHIWLDPHMAGKISSAILDLVLSLDGKNTAYYKENFFTLNKDFQALDKKYRESLNGIGRKEIVVSHDALGYLSSRYGLDQIPISGLSPQDEPTPRKMAQLINLVRKKDIKYILLEEMASPKLIYNLAEETGAQVLIFNPLASLGQEDLDQGQDYFSIMEDNLEKIKKALQ